MTIFTTTAPLDRTVEIAPKILYFGTPVVLVSTINPDGTPNLAAMSSAWAIGWTIVLGLGRCGQTLANLERTGECVLSFPSDDLWEQVERLAPLTGKNPPAPHVAAYGGRFEPRKFEAAGLTPVPSRDVDPPRVRECPLQVETSLRAIRPLADETNAASIEVRVLRVHADPRLLKDAGAHVDPAHWRPLLYVFRHYFGLAAELGRSFRALDSA